MQREGRRNTSPGRGGRGVDHPLRSIPYLGRSVRLATRPTRRKRGFPFACSDLRLVQREEEVRAAEPSKARAAASTGDPVETKHVPPLASAEKQGKGGRHGSSGEKGEEEFVVVPARRKGRGQSSPEQRPAGDGEDLVPAAGGQWRGRRRLFMRER